MQDIMIKVGLNIIVDGHFIIVYIVCTYDIMYCHLYCWQSEK